MSSNLATAKPRHGDAHTAPCRKHQPITGDATCIWRAVCDRRVRGARLRSPLATHSCLGVFLQVGEICFVPIREWRTTCFNARDARSEISTRHTTCAVRLFSASVPNRPRPCRLARKGDL